MAVVGSFIQTGPRGDIVETIGPRGKALIGRTGIHLEKGHRWALSYKAAGRSLPAALLTAMQKSLQETYAPHNACFGCGPANEKGLRIRSFVRGDEVVAEWQGQPYHEAFPGMLNGGIIGTLLDCHSNWTAAHHLMKQAGVDHPPCTVTADYAIKLFRPTPSSSVVHLTAKVVESKQDRAVVEAELIADDQVCATCRGTFVAVKPGHPAYHRW